MSINNKVLYGGVEYNQTARERYKNNIVYNDDWALPSLFGMSVLGFNYRGLLNPFNLSGNFKSLPFLYKKSREWGTPYLRYIGNPKKAIKKLKNVQKGFVPNADGKGTDFLWGQYIPPKKQGENGKGFGLAHIEGRRNEQGYDGTNFLQDLPNLFKNGRKYNKEGHPGRFYIGTDNNEAAIRTDFNGLPWQWLDSAYYKYENK